MNVQVIALLLPLLVAAMIFGVRLASRGKFFAHARFQQWLTFSLLLMVGWLEWDLRINGWWSAAKESRFFPVGVLGVLAVHLVFAVGSLICWFAAFWIGWRGVDSCGRLGSSSSLHARWGWWAVGMTVASALSAEVFFLVAFVA